MPKIRNATSCSRNIWKVTASFSNLFLDENLPFRVLQVNFKSFYIYDTSRRYLS